MNDNAFNAIMITLFVALFAFSIYQDSGIGLLFSFIPLYFVGNKDDE